ncbi:MAG: SIR2 family protein [Aestuariivita sp.]|nr:SIR2 family protein [Aestuariivita sp.]
MRILLFAGAGTSIELGVPGMRGMARRFLLHCRRSRTRDKLVQKLVDLNGEDLEALVESLDSLSRADDIVKGLGGHADYLPEAAVARDEVEWFIRNEASHARDQEATLMWGATISAGRSHNLTLATTNYDCAIEIATKDLDLEIRDGFEQLSEGKFKKWKSVPTNEDNGVRLLKLHGSIDWYSPKNADELVKLRNLAILHKNHNLTLSSDETGEIDLYSAIILPSREKRLNSFPYLELYQAFSNEADQCDIAIFIGSSLRDKHILLAAKKTISRDIPTFIVSYDGKTTVKGAIPIRQHASTFLISTLPNALAEKNPSKTIEILFKKANLPPISVIGILDVVNILSNPEENDLFSRRNAIERIVDTGAALGADLISQLLKDEDSSIARYALALVYDSPYSAILLGEAQVSNHISDQLYREDLRLLEIMLEEREALG